MSLRSCAVLVALALFSLTVPAHAKNLQTSEIQELIAGKRVVLSTSWGAFPLKYGKNQRVTGDGSSVGLAKFFAPKETGDWWVKNNKLCQKWPTWYKGQPFCFSITQTGETTIQWVRDDGYSGTATVGR